MSSPLVEFYLGHSTAGVGWHADIVGRWTDEEWEMHHEFIQWLFPLKTPSAFNPDAPLLTDEDIEEFKNRPCCKTRCTKPTSGFSILSVWVWS